MLDTVVMSGDDVCCSVVFGTLVWVFVFSVMWSELLMTSSHLFFLSCIILSISMFQDSMVVVVVCHDQVRCQIIQSP